MKHQQSPSQRGGAKLFMLLVFLLILGLNNYYWFKLTRSDLLVSDKTAQDDKSEKSKKEDQGEILQVYTGDVSKIDFNTFSALFKGAPTGFGVNPPSKFNQPDFSFKLNINTINRYLALIYQHQIPFGTDTLFKKDYISFAQAKLIVDEQRGVILIKLEKGKLKLSSFASYVMDVEKVRGELLPQINVRGEEIFIDFRLRITEISVKGRPDVVTQSAARHLNSKLIDIKEGHGLISINLSKLLQVSFPFPSRSDLKVKFDLDDANLFFQDDNLHIQLNLLESTDPTRNKAMKAEEKSTSSAKQ